MQDKANQAYDKSVDSYNAENPIAGAEKSRQRGKFEDYINPVLVQDIKKLGFDIEKDPRNLEAIRLWFYTTGNTPKSISINSKTYKFDENNGVNDVPKDKLRNLQIAVQKIQKDMQRPSAPANEGLGDAISKGMTKIGQMGTGKNKLQRQLKSALPTLTPKDYTKWLQDLYAVDTMYNKALERYISTASDENKLQILQQIANDEIGVGKLVMKGAELVYIPAAQA